MQIFGGIAAYFAKNLSKTRLITIFAKYISY